MYRYDHIGNRLTKNCDGSTDTYQYLVNAGTGNTPILDQVLLGIGGARDYTWGPAGHLEEVAAGANVLDFGADAEGRLSGVTRTAAAETAAFGYDGRSFLRIAAETAGGSRSVEPLYDSAGVVHALRRQASPTDPEELVVFFYLAGRPVAQLAVDGTATEAWVYLTTDHLGTPLLATDDSGSLLWEGGFEPFGRDHQQGTPAAALETGIYLRLPGQWEDSAWRDATSGAPLYQNVYRFHAPDLGRYTRPDPARSSGDPHPFAYARSNPLVYTDSLGLVSWRCKVVEASAGHGLGGAGFYVECDSGCVGGKRARGAYGIVSGGLAEGASLPIELGYWSLEDGAATPDPNNLEGPFAYRGCSVTIGIGFSFGEVHQGKGHGGFSFDTTFGLGANCQVVAGRAELTNSTEGCCFEGPGPVIRPR